MIAGNSLRKNVIKNKKIFDRLQIIQPTIKDIKNKTINVIKNLI